MKERRLASEWGGSTEKGIVLGRHRRCEKRGARRAVAHPDIFNVKARDS